MNQNQQEMNPQNQPETPQDNPPQVQLDNGQEGQVPLPPPQEVNTPEVSPTETNPNPQTAGVLAPSEYLSREEFFQVFKDVFEAGGDITGLKSLPISEKENVGAAATARRLYMAAEKYPFLNFIIKRDGGWFVDASLIFVFAAGKSRAVYGEIKQKKVGKAFGWLKFGKNKKNPSESESSAQAEAEKHTAPASS